VPTWISIGELVIRVSAAWNALCRFFTKFAMTVHVG